MKDLTILLIRYLEPYGKQIYDLVQKVDCKKVMINRNPAGIGSLAEAINRGIREVETEFCWIVTNNTFREGSAQDLLSGIIRANECFDCVAIHPCFKSDHHFLNPNGTNNLIIGAPYIEFTSPMVKTHFLKEFPLDESLPYWGHDLDWGYRVRQEGYTLGVHHGVEIKHIYIRDQKDKHPITLDRWTARVASNHSTRQALIAKYGANWREVLSYK